MFRALDTVSGACRRVRVPIILLGAWLFLIAYAYPGYLNYDSGEQLSQVRQESLRDWHPPIMSAYWWVIEHVMHGPLPMLLLQSALFLWGLYELLRHRLDERAAAWVAAALYVFPPIITPMAVVWKDAQMAGFLVAGVALALRPSWRARITGLVLLALAAGVRDNAAAALPHLLLWIAAAWGHRRWVVKYGVGIALFVLVVGTASIANRTLTDHRDHAWYRTTALMDIAGIVSRAGTLSDEELQPILDGTGMIGNTDIQARLRRVYNTRQWFDLSFGPYPVWTAYPLKEHRLARRRAVLELIRRYPGEYAEHRLAVMREVLGLTKSDPWEPVCQTIIVAEYQREIVHHNHTLSWWQRTLGSIYRKLAKTILFRPWAYLLLALIFIGYGLWRRDQALVALAGSGVVYEASFVVFTAAPDYRYSHWMVTCTCLCAVFVFVERLRASGERRATRSAAIPP